MVAIQMLKPLEYIPIALQNIYHVGLDALLLKDWFLWHEYAKKSYKNGRSSTIIIELKQDTFYVIHRLVSILLSY